MGNNIRRIIVGAGKTVRLPISLRKGLFILNCASQNRSIATCSSNRTSVSVTGRNPGTTCVAVIVGTFLEPVAKLVFVVRVIEENEE